VAVGRVVIVGAGPAGAALGYLLARRGVEVALLERHADFERTFRGEPPRTSSGETVRFRRL
jgi:2-polyprenyl-6-methoxyphenol hydroxylase-like FAD-dependent oxidoreductase